jgi:hypothetical protein
MPSRKPRRPSPSPPDPTVWFVHFEEIKAQNRMTIEAVETARQILQAQIEKGDRESRQRDAALQAAIRGEIKVDTLVPLEGRVSAIERRPA